MFEQLLSQTHTVINNAVAKAKEKVVAHFTKYKIRYLIGGGVAAAGGIGYAIGNAFGHVKGKKEGTSEQALRDEAKMKDLENKHRQDRDEWKKIDKEKDDIINKYEQENF